MKNSALYLLLLIGIGCGVKGIKEDNQQKKSPDLYANDSVETGSADSLLKLTDTAFNFTKNSPADSLVLKNGVKLVYLKHGNGTQLKKYDVVALNYRGMLTNKKVFESNEKLGQPVPYVLGLELTFDAFDQALLSCKAGDKIRFTIPSKLAYGEKGRGEIIPPNSDLVYEVDIIDRVSGKKTVSGVELFSLLSREGNTKAEEGDKVELAYQGYIKKTGKLFDASAATGNLYEFDLGTGRAIKAWHEAVATMRKGEKILILAPAATCYGSKGVPELVPPNSDLIYILELKDLTKAAK